MIQTLGVPVTPRGLVVDQYWDWVNSSVVGSAYQLVTGEGTLNQLLLRPNGVSGAIVSLYDGTSTSDPLIYTLPTLGTGDVFNTYYGLRFTKGLFVGVTTQTLKFVLATYRQGV